MHDPLETAELLAFTRVVEARSLTRAAAELAVPRATVGRRLARLEERLGTRLLRRTTRALSLTDAGETFYRHARIVLDAVAQAQASVTADDDVMRGDLRVSFPPVDEPSLMALVTDFAARHPGVRLQVDFSTRIVDLRREGYDLALRAASVIEPGLVARQLRRHRVIAVAAPEYLATFGTPKAVKDLRRHRCLTGFARGELPQSAWRLGKRVVQVESVFSSNELRMLRAAAVRGLGIALLPTIVLGDLVTTGQLVHVLPGLVEAEDRLAVVYPERELVPAHVRAFIDALVAWAPTFATLEPGHREAGTKARKRPRA